MKVVIPFKQTQGQTDSNAHRIASLLKTRIKFYQRSVALLHSFIHGSLSEGYAAALLKVLVTGLLFGGHKLCYVGVVTFLYLKHTELKSKITVNNSYFSHRIINSFPRI